MKKLIIFIIAVSYACISFGQVPNFLKNETIKFNGYYNWGFIWIQAAQVSLSSQEVYKEQPYIKLSARGNTMSSFDWFFKIRDTIVTYVDTNLRTKEYKKITNEGSYHAVQRYYVDSTHVKSIRKKKGKAEKIKDFKLPYNTFDMLGISYYLRTINYEKLRKKEKVPIQVLVDGEIHKLYVTYYGKETIKVKGGKKYQCYKLKPNVVKGNIFDKGGKMTVWLTADKYKIPIMAQAKVIVGYAKGIISNYDKVMKTIKENEKMRN